MWCGQSQVNQAAARLSETVRPADGIALTAAYNAWAMLLRPRFDRVIIGRRVTALALSTHDW